MIPVQWNPYLESESESAVSRLRDEQVDLAVMDCFGYSRKMRDFAAQSLGKPVILSRTMAARVLLEIV
ncbi:MAG: AroM family protein [Dysosmobacter welbionis]|uniref:AroM family protein n=1 Tax=Dysosmobacter welbionis TaxID=2093857 RepID=UPI003990E6E1